MVQPVAMAAWERFGVEFILTFIVVLTHCVSAERPRIPFGATSSPALAIGAVYGACTLVSVSNKIFIDTFKYSIRCLFKSRRIVYTFDNLRARKRKALSYFMFGFNPSVGRFRFTTAIRQCLGLNNTRALKSGRKYTKTSIIPVESNNKMTPSTEASWVHRPNY